MVTFKKGDKVRVVMEGLNGVVVTAKPRRYPLRGTVGVRADWNRNGRPGEKFIHPQHLEKLEEN